MKCTELRKELRAGTGACPYFGSSLRHPMGIGIGIAIGIDYDDDNDSHEDLPDLLTKCLVALLSNEDTVRWSANGPSNS